MDVSKGKCSEKNTIKTSLKTMKIKKKKHEYKNIKIRKNYLI